MAEVRPIPGFPDYEVSDEGDVWSNRRSNRTRFRRIKMSASNSSGYHLVWLRDRSVPPRCAMMAVHRLVLLAFVGPAPEGLESCHNDGNRSNNRLSNLRYDTPKANAEDRARHGRTTHGEQHHSAKLNTASVLTIRELHRSGFTMADLARQYRVAEYSIKKIVRRMTWKHVA